MDDTQEFISSRKERIGKYPGSEAQLLADKLLASGMDLDYYLNFDWMSVPICQWPQDIVAMQEIIWSVKPDLIIETGIARGGSLVFYASMLALLDLAEGKAPLTEGQLPKRTILGVDIDFREHNKKVIDGHFLRNYIDVVDGSSVDPGVYNKVYQVAKKHRNILVMLDSNHTHEHVLAELEMYAPLTSVDSYCIVFDTFLNKLEYKARVPDRHGTIDRNAGTAVLEFMKSAEEGKVKDPIGVVCRFVQDKSVTDKLLCTSCSEGYLRRTNSV